MAAYFIDPGASAEVLTNTTAAALNSFNSKKVRYFKAPRNGLLLVEMMSSSGSTEIPVVHGVNPERITGVYSSLNTMQIVGFW